jgi:hypothetical protein
MKCFQGVFGEGCRDLFNCRNSKWNIKLYQTFLLLYVLNCRFTKMYFENVFKESLVKAAGTKALLERILIPPALLVCSFQRLETWKIIENN